MMTSDVGTYAENKKGRRAILDLRKQRRWTAFSCLFGAAVLTAILTVFVVSNTAGASGPQQQVAVIQPPKDQITPVYTDGITEPVAYLLTAQGKSFFCSKNSDTATEAYTCQQLP